MRIVQWLGNASDFVTLRMITKRPAGSYTDEQELQRMGGIRSAQLQAVLSMTPIMMSANILSAGSILLLEINIDQAGPSVILWAAAAFAYSVIFMLRSRKIGQSGWRPVASPKAPGKIILSSLILAVLWAYPVLTIMNVDSGLETTFISITTAGMITGGALALYPVPFAAATYAALLTAATLPAVFSGSSELVAPFLIGITAFLAIVFVSIHRQAGLFFLELDAKINAENQLAIAELIFKSVSSEEPQVTWRTDMLSRITCHQTFETFFEFPKGSQPDTLQEILESAGLTAKDATGETALQGLMRGDYSALLAEPVFLFDSRGRAYKLAGKHTVSASGLIIGHHGYIRDITEQNKAAQRIVNLATRDHATGLLNYHEFQTRAMRRKLEKPAAAGKQLFMFIDADNLKAVNDNFGHQAGDFLIMKIAHDLVKVLPPDSLIARKGGDEFIAFLDAEDLDVASQLVEALSIVLRSSFRYGQHTISYSCSIGASFSDAEKPLELLELEADRALYDVKKSPRKGSQFYDDVSGAEVTRSRGLITDLSSAVDERSIDLFYQPIIASDGFTVLGAEALLRWFHPKFGAVSPAEILAAARSTGLMHVLTLYVIREACMDAARWPADCFVSVNICATDFRQPELSTTIIHLLEDLLFAPDRLWLEITESEAIGSCTATSSNMRRLRAAGIKIAIDDFGAGYSSLNLLSSSLFDIVKIDRSLVMSCEHGSNSRLILEAVRGVAQATGCIVVAEGVETESEYREMVKIGCQAVQGYFFDRPMPAPVILDRVRRIAPGLIGR